MKVCPRCKQPGDLLDLGMGSACHRELKDCVRALMARVAVLECPFCHPDKPYWEDAKCYVVHDAYPVSPGHSLVIPKKHVVSLSDLLTEEQAGVWMTVANLVRDMKGGRYLSGLQPTGFNIGVNDGVAAGQTVMHAHVHIIPRYDGGGEDPRGGIRWVLPEKARYW